MNFVVQAESTLLNGRVNGDDRIAVAAYRDELDDYYRQIVQFREMEPDLVLLTVSGISARLIAIRAQLVRSSSQRANKLRTSEIDPLIDHLKQQAQLHSRLITMRQLDWQLSGGQT
jgi:hypothetical protein